MNPAGPTLKRKLSDTSPVSPPSQPAIHMERRVWGAPARSAGSGGLPSSGGAPITVIDLTGGYGATREPPQKRARVEQAPSFGGSAGGRTGAHAATYAGFKPAHQAPSYARPVTLKQIAGGAVVGGAITVAASPPPSRIARSGSGRGKTACFKCGEVGHWASQCSQSRGAGSRGAGGGDGARGLDQAGRTPMPSTRGNFRQLPAGFGAKKSLSSGSLRARSGPPPSPDELIGSVKAKLSPDQARGLALALEGHSLFFTGSAGTGKSLLLREMVRLLRELHGDEAVYVTASTGLAACNIGGCTLHSYAGVGLGEENQDVLATKVMGNKKSRERWLLTKVLIVDEVSMVEGTLFDKLEYIARKVRGQSAPFGGIQLILSGDFLQLPPVNTKTFCFESEAWKRCIRKVVVLTHVFRQSDNAFVELLNDLRVGKVTEEGRQILRRCMIPFTDRVRSLHSDDDLIQATLLYPHRRDVDDENGKRLEELPGATRVYRAIDSGEEPFLSMLSRNCSAPETLELKLNAQVILLKNLDPYLELVNGSRGVVVDFKRVITPENSNSPSFDTGKEYPEVLFTSGVRRIITPEEWNIEVAGEQKATRLQCPLALAWALSIHKAQGMSISKVQMKLGNVWEYGQAYVALSRATTLDGLYIMNLNERAIMAHPKVLNYYADLEAQQATATTASRTTTIKGMKEI